MYCLRMDLFFCEQKTADEMRISDWISDVCSSVLHLEEGDPFRRLHRTGPAQRLVKADAVGQIGDAKRDKAKSLLHRMFPSPPLPPAPCPSEEHTSELQSLMRISYAVFCLKKKKNITIQQKTIILNIRNSPLTSQSL